MCLRALYTSLSGSSSHNKYNVIMFNISTSAYLKPTSPPPTAPHARISPVELRISIRANRWYRTDCPKAMAMRSVDGTAEGVSSAARKRAAQGPWKQVYKSWARFSPRALRVKRVAWVHFRGKGSTPRVFEPMALEQQPGTFPTWTSADELHGWKGCWMVFVWKRRNLYEAPTGRISGFWGTRQ